MASDAVIVRNPYHQVPYLERDCGGVITPGDLCEVEADGDVNVHGTAAQPQTSALFADLPVDPEKDKSDDYAANERGRFIHALPGVVVDAFIANNETIGVGDRLVSAGDGTLRELDTAGGDSEAAVVAEAEEAVSPTGGAVRCEVRVV